MAAGQARDPVPAVRAGRALERLEADRALELVQSLALRARGGAALERGEALGPRRRVVGGAARRRGGRGATRGK